MANPVLNQRTIDSGAASWAPPIEPPPAIDPNLADPYTKPVRSSEAMTIGGTVGKTAALLGVVLVFAAIGWRLTGAPTIDPITGQPSIGLPGLAFVGMIAGIGLTFLLYFKPQLARIVAPLYAVAEGVFIGAISRVYETYYDGVVIQAIGATLAVLAVMLVLYSTRIIKVTQRMRSIIISATLGLMAFYLISFVIGLFGVNIGFLSQPTGLGIAFSIFASGLAAANLLLDFDIIERGAQRRFNKDFEWYAAFGLLVTLVWLYLEMLRLLSKLRSR